jgi:hypothetical protein
MDMGKGYTRKSKKDRSTLTSFGPVITCTVMTKDKIVRAEEVTQWPRPNGIHGCSFKVNHDGTWNVLVRFSLIIIDRNTFKLLVVVANVVTIWTDAVLVRNSLPELGTCVTYTDLTNSRTVSLKHTDLVATLKSKV